MPWETDGPSNTPNCGLLCDRHHPLKTDRHITVTNSSADGSLDYTTAWGQSLHIPPRPYLDDPGKYQPHRDEVPAREADPPADPPPRLHVIRTTDAQSTPPRHQMTDSGNPPF